jgi:hypothetical protein
LLEPVDAPALSSLWRRRRRVQPGTNEPSPTGLSGNAPNQPRPLRRPWLRGLVTGLTGCYPVFTYWPLRQPARGHPAAGGTDDTARNRFRFGGRVASSPVGPSLRRWTPTAGVECNGCFGNRRATPGRHPVSLSSARLGGSVTVRQTAPVGCLPKACFFWGAGRLRSPLYWGMRKPLRPTRLMVRRVRAGSRNMRSPTLRGRRLARFGALRGDIAAFPHVALFWGRRWANVSQRLRAAPRSDTALRQAFGLDAVSLYDRLWRPVPARCG